MSLKSNEEEFGKYIVTIITISRKILRLLFDLELTKNKELSEEIEKIKKNPQPEKDLYFFEDTLDFKSLIKLLNIYNREDKLIILINKESNNAENDKNILRSFLNDILQLRNELWHNNINYKNPKKYYKIILIIKEAYEMLKNNKSINKSELLGNCINYLDICLEFFNNYN